MAQTSHREQLFAGAIACLQAKGYARTTARDIAAAADANLASIGYHFGSKEGLLDEALMRAFDHWVSHLTEVGFANRDASPIECLTSIWQEMSAAFERHRPLVVAFMEAMAQAERSPALRQRMADHYEELRTRVSRLIAEALGSDGDTHRAAASALIALSDGLAIQTLLDPEHAPAGDRMISGLLDTLAQAASQSTQTPAE